MEKHGGETRTFSLCLTFMTRLPEAATSSNQRIDHQQWEERTRGKRRWERQNDLEIQLIGTVGWGTRGSSGAESAQIHESALPTSISADEEKAANPSISLPKQVRQIYIVNQTTHNFLIWIPEFPFASWCNHRALA